MLFRNLKSGNLVNATNEATIAIMKGSDNYEIVKASRGKDKTPPNGKEPGEGQDVDKTDE